jgi:hypothetical protein
VKTNRKYPRKSTTLHFLYISVMHNISLLNNCSARYNKVVNHWSMGTKKPKKQETQDHIHICLYNTERDKNIFCEWWLTFAFLTAAQKKNIFNNKKLVINIFFSFVRTFQTIEAKFSQRSKSAKKDCGNLRPK